MTSTLIESNLPRLNAPTLHQLPNGLTIVAEQMPIEAVNLSLWLGIGSAVESNEINGMAHFLEHMIFKGTSRLQSGEFEKLIEERGAVTNAATSQDYTQYYITTAPSDFATLAPLQIEVALNAAIPDEAFERERSVILEEIRRSDDSPQRRVFSQAMTTAFDRLPYRRPVLGPASVIEQVTPQQMRDFHQTWYRPQSITAVAVGNLPVSELVDIVAAGFETAQAGRPIGQSNSIAIPAWEVPDTTPEPIYTQIDRQELIDPSLQQARLVMMWRVPGMLALPASDALDILASVMGRGRTARLVRQLREEQGLVSGIGVSNLSYTHQGLFYISAQLPSQNLAAVEAAIVAQIERVQTEALSEAELSKIRTLVANRHVFSNETPSDRAGMYGYCQAIMSDLTPALNYPERIRAIDAEAIQSVAQRYLSPTAYRAVIVKPSAA